MSQEDLFSPTGSRQVGRYGGLDSANALAVASAVMPYFLIRIGGSVDRAAGLLAVAGIQNLVEEKGVSARLRAEDGEQAVQRVGAALEGEPFTFEEFRPEP